MILIIILIIIILILIILYKLNYNLKESFIFLIKLFSFFFLCAYLYEFISNYYFLKKLEKEKLEKEKLEKEKLEKEKKNCPECLEKQESNDYNNDEIFNTNTKNYLIKLYFFEKKFYFEIINTIFKDKGFFPNIDSFFSNKIKNKYFKIYSNEELQNFSIVKLQKLIAKFQDENDLNVELYQNYIKLRKDYNFKASNLKTEFEKLELEKEFLEEVKNLFK